MTFYYLDIETVPINKDINPESVIAQPEHNKIISIQYQELWPNGNKKSDLMVLKEWECHNRSITGSKLYNWLKRNNFPKGFQTMCINCNFAKGMFGVCPHQS